MGSRTRELALAALAVRLGAEEGSGDTETELRVLAERTRQQFAEQDVTEDTVEDAIAWARSE